MMEQLQEYAIPFKERECAETAFKIEVDFSVPPNAYPDVLVILVALLNSMGGILTLVSLTNLNKRLCIIDTWKKKLCTLLRTFIPEVIQPSCLNSESEIISGTLYVHLVVPKSPRMLLAQTSMQVYSTRLLNENICCKEIPSIRKKVYLEPQLLVNKVDFCQTTFRYDEQFPLQESPNVEFKNYKCYKLSHLLYKLESDERMLTTLLAMPNLPGGGYIFIGIKEDGHTETVLVKGQILEENDKPQIEKKIQTLLVENPKNHQKRIWGRPGIHPEQNKHWSIKYYPVTCSPDKMRAVIQIRLEHFPGGVFHKLPDIYDINKLGYVQQLSFDQVQHVIMSNDCNDEKTLPISFQYKLTYSSWVNFW